VKLVVQELVIHAPRAHHGGWRHYLGRLCALAQGEPPGPDPLADRSVPSFADDGRP
jgi:hypothetical protein